MFASGDRASWLNAIAAKIMDGGRSPPSLDRLNIIVPPEIVTKENDGHVTAAAALGEKSRPDYKAGWRIIITEMITLLREQGFVGGSDDGLTWIKPLDGTWQITMPDKDRIQITIFGQRERRMSRDRAIVGERAESDGNGLSRVGVPSLFETGKLKPFELDVIGPRGGITQQSFELHPFALAIPPMTEREREQLRASIERDGVKVPIVIYQKKILDGRNRGYFASVFHKPVRIEEFEGTEEQARRYVAILNLHRRHLSSAQQSLVAINLFGEKATKETAAALERGRIQGGKLRVSSPLKIAESKAPDRSNEWHEIVAREAKDAGLNVTGASIRAMKEVMDAPETKAKVESGEIKIVSNAAVAARAEKGLPKLKTFAGVNPRSITKHTGEIIYHYNAMLTDLEMPVGSMPDRISDRLDEMDRLNAQLRQAFRNRKVIT